MRRLLARSTSRPTLRFPRRTLHRERLDRFVPFGLSALAMRIPVLLAKQVISCASQHLTHVSLSWLFHFHHPPLGPWCRETPDQNRELDHEAHLRSNGHIGFHRRIDAGVGCPAWWRRRWRTCRRNAWRRLPRTRPKGGTAAADTQYAESHPGPFVDTGWSAGHQWAAQFKRDAGDGQRLALIGIRGNNPGVT
jgi:hypothetical protein